jgi:hypothetical protein
MASSTSKGPQQWTVDEVQEWLKFVVHEYSLVHLDTSVFQMDGRQLAAMTVERFLEIEPNTGDILYEIVQGSSPSRE